MTAFTLLFHRLLPELPMHRGFERGNLPRSEQDISVETCQNPFQPELFYDWYEIRFLITMLHHPMRKKK